MSGFSPEWLALREPVDHRSRDPQLMQSLAATFADRPRLRIVDLGCGTGSNLRGTFRALPSEQHWTLVDYDLRLLAAARATLLDWADRAEASESSLVLAKGGKTLHVAFRQADLVRDLDAALAASPDLVTAAAFFDLASPEFIGHLAAAVAARRAAFYTVLTYNGQQSWTPHHTADSLLLMAFHDHQRGDKGFGASAGPAAPAALSATFQSAGYHVTEGDSPWLLGPAEARLIADLAAGFADAAAEMGTIPPSAIAEWRAVTRTGAVVGHTDSLALPPPQNSANPPRMDRGVEDCLVADDAGRLAKAE
ncbi:MAG: class I SAM-dependent methyltransferase [Hyphomicrobiaceae bacterium]|nr:class I SAM-dependent methyltransferase [Hyphomicrobiaceae bacterium]